MSRGAVLTAKFFLKKKKTKAMAVLFIFAFRTETLVHVYMSTIL